MGQEKRKVLIQKEMEKTADGAMNELMAQKARAAEVLKDPSCEFIMIAIQRKPARDLEAADEGYCNMVGIVAATQGTLMKMLPEVIHIGERIVESCEMTKAQVAEAFEESQERER